MKGRLLTSEQVRSLKEGTKVWFDGEYCNELCVKNDYILKSVEDGDPVILMEDLDYSSAYKYYEWIEDKEITYKSEYRTYEIYAQAEKLFNKKFIGIKSKYNSVVVLAKSYDSNAETIYGLAIQEANEMKMLQLNGFEKWELINDELVDFKTAFNSDKNIKPFSLRNEKKFHPYSYWLGFMVSQMNRGIVLDLINGEWLIEGN